MAHADTAVIRAASASPGDAVAIEDHHRCFCATYTEQLAAGTVTAPDRAGTRTQLHGWLQRDSGFRTRVADLDQVVIGHVTVCGPNLVHLFVAPEHQGGGLGRRLLAEGEAMMAADGHRDVELHVRIDNPAAIAFYEHAGWTMTDRRIHTAEHGIRYDEHVLVKHIE